MNLNHAYSIIVSYSVERGVDELSGIEQMVKNYRLLTQQEKTALETFMAETKQPVDHKMY
jgi:hypothetical protein